MGYNSQNPCQEADTKEDLPSGLVLNVSPFQILSCPGQNLLNGHDFIFLRRILPSCQCLSLNLKLIAMNQKLRRFLFPCFFFLPFHVSVSSISAFFFICRGIFQSFCHFCNRQFFIYWGSFGRFLMLNLPIFPQPLL